MNALRAYQFTVQATHEQYPEDTSIHFIAANTYEEALQHVRNNLENAGWTIKSVVTRDVTIWDIR